MTKKNFFLAGPAREFQSREDEPILPIQVAIHNNMKIPSSCPLVDSIKNIQLFCKCLSGLFQPTSMYSVLSCSFYSASGRMLMSLIVSGPMSVFIVCAVHVTLQTVNLCTSFLLITHILRFNLYLPSLTLL